ncbi:uncharacterized protein [Chironomus tepperi]|uniref:uncharacterized protein n=1 Tax=Chironomus tepperi TaxID=113505 RepID=UPI00391F160B
MDIFELIEANNIQGIKNAIKNGVNIYQTRYFPSQSEEPLSSELNQKYFNAGINPSVLTVKLPLLHSAIFCDTDEVANYLLDIYERDLEVLKGTNFKKALVATAEDQTEEFLSYCQYSIQDDAKFMEPVLLKNNNLDTPKLAFLNRKLKNSHDKSLKFIKLLEKNGTCDLNIQLGYRQTLFFQFINSRKFDVAVRLLKSHFVDEDMNSEEMKMFMDEFFFTCDESFHEFFFSHIQFDQKHITWCTYFKVDYEKLNFVLNQMIKHQKCSMNDILRLECNSLDHSIHYDKSIVLHEIIKSDLYEDLNLEFDEELFFPDDDQIIENFFNSWLNYNENLEKIERFFKKHPKLLTLKSQEHFSILHFVLMTANYKAMKIIFKLYEDTNIFKNNEETAVKCLQKSSKLFYTDHKEATEVLKLILQDDFESFITKHGTKIIHNLSDARNKIRCAIYFLSLPFFRISFENDTSIYNSIFDNSSDCWEEFKPFFNAFPIPDWNICNSEGVTLFMAACMSLNDDVEFLKTIIEKQPDCVDRRTSNNSTCLHFVANHKTSDIARILVERGIDPQVMNSNNEKPIFMSCNNFEVFSYLLQFENDEDLNARYGDDQVTLFSSIKDRAAMELLLTRNIDPLAPSHEGQPSIFMQDAPDVIDLIFDQIKCGKLKIDINMKDNEGNGFLVRAVKNYNWKYLEMILEYFKDELDFGMLNIEDENFSMVALSLHSSVFIGLLEIIEKYCLNEFIENITELDKIDPDNLLLILKYLDINVLSDNFDKLINHETVVRNMLKNSEFFNLLIKSPAILLKAIQVCINEKSIEVILSKLGQKVFNNSECNNENILHAVCKVNNRNIIDQIILFLSTEQIYMLSNQIYDGKKPFDLLNDELKDLYENVLNYSE